MNNPIKRLQALLDMKSSLCRALAQDLDDACNKIEQRDCKIEAMKTELDVYVKANQSLRERHMEDSKMIKLLEDDVFLLGCRADWRGEKMTQQQQEIELLKTEKRQLQDEIDKLRERPEEWWRELDEDEDYIASIEVAALPDIPFDETEKEPTWITHEEEQ